MADDLDRAAEREEIARTSALLTCKKPAGPVPNGTCHYCDEPVADGQRWCDEHCREDWEREQRLRGRR